MTPETPLPPAVPVFTPEPPPPPPAKDKSKWVMIIIILILIGIIASMQFCSNRKIEQAIQRLDSAQVRLTDAQHTLDSASNHLDKVSKSLEGADKQIDNSGIIVSRIKDQLTILQLQIDESIRAANDKNDGRNALNKRIAEQISAKDVEIRALKSRLNHQNQ